MNAKLSIKHMPHFNLVNAFTSLAQWLLHVVLVITTVLFSIIPNSAPVASTRGSSAYQLVSSSGGQEINSYQFNSLDISSRPSSQLCCAAFRSSFMVARRK
jgi:hypothetical protein